MSPDSDNDQGGTVGDQLRSAWWAFCDALKTLPDGVVGAAGAPSTPREVAEGYRYLARQTRIALEDHVEYADPGSPRFYEFTTPTRKTGIDNPDTIYLTTAVSPEHSYRVWGNVGTVAYIGFGLYAGYYGSSRGMQTIAHYNATDFSIEADGSIELILSATRPAQPNWIQLPDATRRFDVRQTRLDRGTERPATVQIELLDADREPDISPQRMMRGLTEAAEYAANGLTLWAGFVQSLQAHTNNLIPITRQRAADLLSNMDTYYSSGYWSLGPDEALVVDLAMPPCRYWSLQVASHWMESFSDRRTVINAADAVHRAPGHVRVVLSASDPGHPNWLDVGGYSCGTMTLRAVLAEQAPHARTTLTGSADVGSLPFHPI
jgi:hypothetical protein